MYAMARATLLDFFDDVIASEAAFLSYDDGYRQTTYAYAAVGRAAGAFAVRLERAGVGAGGTVLFWAENRPEWIAAFWGCLLRGAIVVPIDFRVSADFVARVARAVDARLLLAGDDTVVPDSLHVATWRLADLEWPDSAPEPPPRPPVTASDTVQIIYTSGATSEPKGVVITHRNILANILPIEREVAKYRRYASLVAPIRFLNLLPLSHMFGQAMATFVPPMLEGEVIFMRGLNPREIAREIRERRVSVLVSVPKLLGVLRDHLIQRFPHLADAQADDDVHWLRRWWRYRSMHRELGWKFWCLVVGAAPLEPPLEAFWSRLGYLVVQGYGLTETAPIVTLNHPFAARRGSVGKPIAGVEVRIADDGEILVRGENVTTGYFNAPDETASTFEDGWLRTGDIGGLDEEGRLYVRGRKKEMIVTPEGLNVFPDDVERIVNQVPGVVESAAVGQVRDGEERVHAVLVLEPGTELDAVVRESNRRLEGHQRIRGASRWPHGALPRTEGTRKIRRRELRDWVGGAEEAPRPRAAPDATVEDVIRRFTRGQTDVRGGTTIEELGLGSLERIELQMALEEQFDVTVDEARFADARTVDDLRQVVAPAALPGRAETERVEPVRFPSWNRTRPAYLVRRLSFATWLGPLLRAFVKLRVEGLEHLDAAGRGPVVFAASHQSHMDTPAIFAALPPGRRYRTAVAMAKEFFRPHFFPEQHGRRAWLTNSVFYVLAATFFNAFPLPQREAGTRQTLRYIGDLVGAGHSILIFPEGKRTDRGEINPFQPGIGMIGARLRVPIVPVRVEGLDRILHQTWRMARPGQARIAFGPPVRLSGDDYPALARQVEDAVRAL